MKYLLDTDHLSILQRKSGSEYVRLSTWMSQASPLDFACCVISLHEQVVGAHAFLNQAKNSMGPHPRVCLAGATAPRLSGICSLAFRRTQCNHLRSTSCTDGAGGRNGLTA